MKENDMKKLLIRIVMVYNFVTRKFFGKKEELTLIC